MARPKSGPASGAGKRCGNITPMADARGRDPQQHGCCRGPQAPPSLSPGKPPEVFTHTQKAALGQLDTNARPFSGLAWTSGYSQSGSQTRDTRGVARPNPGLGSGSGKSGGDVTPGNTAAARFPRHGQVRLLGSNQQSSRPLRRLLRGGSTPKRGLFRAERGRASTANLTPGQGTLGAWLDPSPSWQAAPVEWQC